MLSINYVTDHCSVFHEFEILPANVYDALFGSDLLDVNMSKVNETWQTAGDLAALIATIGSIVDNIHDSRHAYVIRLAEEGCLMHFISEVMGHHSVDFTRRRYARFSPDSASRAVLRVLQGRKAGPVGAQNGHS
jgi:integrase